MAGRAFDPKDYELHQVEREELHEEWVWVRDENKTHIDGCRPALLLEFEGKRVYGETLFADGTYLRNRHKSILIGKTKNIHKTVGHTKQTFRFTLEWDKRDKFTASFVVEGKEKFAWDIDKQPLAENQTVQVRCPRGEEDIKAAKGEIVADGVGLEDNRLVFMNAWYRRRLGLNSKHFEKPIPLKVNLPKTSRQAMWWQLRACVQHPQIAVTMSMVLAIIGTGLGIMGLAVLLKDLSGWKGFSVFDWASLTAAVFGFIIIFVVGLGPLYFRAKQVLRDET